MDVVIACSSEQELAFVQIIAALYPDQQCDLSGLSGTGLYQQLDLTGTGTHGTGGIAGNDLVYCTAFPESNRPQYL